MEIALVPTLVAMLAVYLLSSTGGIDAVRGRSKVSNFWQRRRIRGIEKTTRWEDEPLPRR